jgi:hypothetical protein
MLEGLEAWATLNNVYEAPAPGSLVYSLIMRNMFSSGCPTASVWFHPVTLCAIGFKNGTRPDSLHTTTPSPML